MKHRKFKILRNQITPLALTGLAVGASTVAAQEKPDIDFSQFEGIEQKGWFVRLGGRALFNAKASVSRSVQTTGPGYWDNGFVLPDVGGTASGLTWNWNYQHDSGPDNQIIGETINYDRYLGLPDAGSFSGESEIAPGGEMMIGVRFGEFQVGKKTWEWGAEFGGGYNVFKVSGAETATSNATYETAAYDTNGILLPVAPYTGTYNGPGPVIDLNPNAPPTSTTGTATSAVDGSLESNLYNFKIGVWFDMPLTKKLDLSWSAGFSSLYSDTQYKFTEDITFPTAPSLDSIDTTVGGRNWQQGGYIQARLQYEFNDSWSAYVGADYQYNGKFRFNGAGRDIDMDFTALFGASLGIQFNW